jgi:CRP/FNR family transcriptional regulator, nitrogen oxide reductase regulator
MWFDRGPLSAEPAIVTIPTDATLLDRVPLFAGLDAAAREAVLRAARRHAVRSGEPIFRQDEEARSLFVLAGGRLKVTQLTADGQQVVVRFIGPGEMFGCVAVLGQNTYPGTATAVEDSVAIGWDQGAMARLIEAYPPIAMNALGTVGARLQETQTRLRELATQKVERRIAHTVIRLARQSGRRVPGGVQIEFPISRQDIAEMAGTTLHTVSRVLSAWEQRGLVDSGRRRVVVRKPHDLVAIAEELDD